MSLRLKVIDGTPDHSKSLCLKCDNGAVRKGQQVSDITIHCRVCCERPMPITRPIVECTEFRERHNNTRTQMERIAWVLETKRGRPIGFFNPTEHTKRVDEGIATDDEHG